MLLCLLNCMYHKVYTVFTYIIMYVHIYDNITEQYLNVIYCATVGWTIQVDKGIVKWVVDVECKDMQEMLRHLS